MNNYFSKKIYRLFESKNFLKINFLIQKYFKEKDIGNLNLNFSDKPNRVEIIKNIIKLKNYRNYLEIGCLATNYLTKLIVKIK